MGMNRFRTLALVMAVIAALALAPTALAGPDPHGHGGGKDKGGGKPSPSPTVEPSAAPAPDPTASEAPSPAEDPTDPPTSAPAEDEQAGSGPGGGSGIVKLDRRPWDQAPNNEPHVGCTFQLDFYNYPEGVTARYSFTLWPPTGPADLDGGSGSLFIGDDPAGGGQDLDGEATVELGPALLSSGIEPHHHNGWHVRVVVRARATAGADQKQKVFWVRACKAEEPEEPEEPTVSPTTVTPPSPIAFTGSDVARPGMLALLALVLGTGMLWASARLRREGP
jgi:hypothetical protein